MKITISPSTNDNRSIAEQLEIITMANREGYLLPLVLLAEQYIKNGDGDPASCYHFAQHDLANNAYGGNRDPWSKEVNKDVPRDQDAQDDDRDKVF